MRAADAAIAATKAAKPSNAAQARARCAELMNLQQTQIEAARKVVAANAQKRIANGSNGKAKAPAEVTASNLTDEFLDALVTGIVNWAKPLFTALEQRIAALEEKKGIAPLAARLGALEQHALSDGGTWKPDKLFKLNQVATYHGAMWICLKENSDVRPGTSDHWRLMHKTPKDGR